VVLDNESHGSTGGQRTIAETVHLEQVAKACGYAWAERVKAEDLEAALPAFLSRQGPAMLLVKVEKGNVKGIGRVEHTPPEITARFARACRS
jgi:thiamine pyrophosphate-dependent acetolactate synthase large subunit-like protein